jgi:hypothetical protein
MTQVEVNGGQSCIRRKERIESECLIGKARHVVIEI